MRTTSEKARRAITEAALITFCERGYGLATLEEIGAQVGLTRGAVLHHFKSKTGLLAAVVEPCLQALAQLLVTTTLNDPPTANQRRQLLTKFADLFIAHRGPLKLLANDISARVQLGLNDQWLMPPERLVQLLVGSKADHLNQVRVASAIGAMIQPVTLAWVDLDNVKTRGELVEAAVAVFHGPRATASTANPKITALAPNLGAGPLTRMAAS